MTRSPEKRGSAPTIAALVGLSGFLVTTLLVWLGATDRLDLVTRDLFRPDDVWGTPQEKLGPIIDALAPPRMFALLGAVTIVALLARRSVRPVLVALALVVPTLVAAGAVKFLVGRADPHAVMSATGGSYPSGHMVALVACLGGCLLVWETRTRWFYWVPIAFLATWMALAMLYGAAHWLTDVVGGAFLAVGTLGLAALASRTGRPTRDAVGPQATSART
jgi:membrane-associated phospholipid phosphatase